MGLTQKLGTIPLAIFTDASNNVGIGGSPSGSYKFEVTGTGRFTSTLLVSGAATLGTGTSAYTFGGGSAAAGGLTDKDLTLKAWSPTSGTNEYGGDLILAAGVGTGNTSGKLGNVIVRVGTEGATSSTLGTLSTIATFTKTGLGIGTSSPSELLHIYSSAASAEIRLQTSAMSSYIRSQSDNLNFYINNGERMRITSNGNLLINQTTNEDGKLQVNGTDNNVIAHMKSTSGRLQYYAYYGPYGGSIIQSLNGAGSAYLNLRIETSTMTVSGNQTVTGTKSFAIEHPLDSTKTLLHYSTESPKADLIYRGKINLVNGKAEINIDLSSKMTDGTFIELCRDVQCFTTNETGWDLVKGKVNGNILTIESNNQNSTDEISWMVIGERYDESIKNSNMLDEDGDLIVEKEREVSALENKS